MKPELTEEERSKLQVNPKNQIYVKQRDRDQEEAEKGREREDSKEEAWVATVKVGTLSQRKESTGVELYRTCIDTYALD